MAIAYVDTSAIVAITLGEPGAKRARAALRQMDSLLSSNLLEAEYFAVLKREQLEPKAGQALNSIQWLHPNRPLTSEINFALSFGYLRGADLWHVATALFFANPPNSIYFATLDDRQAEVAAALGFKTLW